MTLACNRTLSASAKVQLVWGKGVSTPAKPGQTQGLPNTVERRFDYRVREPFTATFSCERENAQSACLPIRPMRLHFNAPVPAKLLGEIRLKGAKESFKPVSNEQGEELDGEQSVNSVRFEGLFPEQAQFTLELPKGFKDASGRSLRNGDSFPLKVATAAMPPLAKFAAAPFGVVERLAEPDGVALLPVTLRNVEPALRVQGLSPGAAQPAGKVSTVQPGTDAEIIAWYRKVQHFDQFWVSRGEAARNSKTPLPKDIEEFARGSVQSRLVSLLQGQGGVRALDLPKPASGDPRPFEVVGIPLGAGFHVVEIASQALGKSLIDERHGDQRTMYRAHRRAGDQPGRALQAGPRERPGLGDHAGQGHAGGRCAGARVGLPRQGTGHGRDRRHWRGPSEWPVTRGPGLQRRPVHPGLLRQRPRHPAHTADGKGTVQDMAFTWSDWNRGIEAWRFNLPTSTSARPDERAHTVFDRTLLRAGETVSMKHILRSETSSRLQPAPGHAGHAGHHPRGQRPAVHPAAGLAQDGYRRPLGREQFCHSARGQAGGVRGAAARCRCLPRHLHHRAVPRGGIPPAGARRARGPGRQEGAGEHAKPCRWMCR